LIGKINMPQTPTWKRTRTSVPLYGVCTNTAIAGCEGAVRRWYDYMDAGGRTMSGTVVEERKLFRVYREKQLSKLKPQDEKT
jgi:hypothetical protein